MNNTERHQMSKHQLESQLKTDEVTCKDCKQWKWCSERSREYPCIYFKKKKVSKNGKGQYKHKEGKEASRFTHGLIKQDYTEYGQI